VKSFIHGNLGYSLSYNVEINRLIWERLRNTLLLGGTAMLVAWGLALPMGVCSGRFPGGWMDRLFIFSSTVLLGTPELALALFLILLAAHFGTLPTGGMSSAENQSGFAVSIDIIRHLVIPAAALALAAVPMLFRHVRAAVAEAYGATFVEAARGHGVGEGRLLFRHVLPVAANPLISLFGLSLAALVSGSFLVEVLCGWPGLGPLFLEATYNHDSLVVLAIVMLFSLFLIAGNLAADLLLYAADPRVRAE
jgi:peptide/nickel transport system permease protein